MLTAHYLVIVTAIVCFYLTSCEDVKEQLEALENGDYVRYAELNGMDLKVFEVVTADNWLLHVNRIRNLEIYDQVHSTPVYLSHGFGVSSFDFMANARNESLAFILADHGYDVWVVSYRATIFSNMKIKNGKPVKPEAEDYYTATWQYMAEYDVPAVFDRIFKETGQEKIFIVGQSMGSTVLFAFLSENKNYDYKILHFEGMVPVIAIDDDSSLLLRTTMNLAPYLKNLLLGPLFRFVFGRQVLAANGTALVNGVNYVKRAICKHSPTLCMVVTNVLFQRNFVDFFKANPHFRIETRIPVFFVNFPGGITAMNGFLFAIQNGKKVWTKMDYDEVPSTGITNQQAYNSTKPPAYDFGTMRVDYFLHFVENDVFIGPNSVHEIIDELKFDGSRYKIIKSKESSRFSHHDTLWGWDARCWIYNDTIKRFNDIEISRGKKEYRDKVSNYVANLPFENGCLDLGTKK